MFGGFSFGNSSWQQERQVGMLRKQIYSVLVFLGIVVSVSNAQTLPGYMRFQAAGWTFAPAISQGSVAGFLAWPGEAEPIGNNIKVMWFQRVKGEWQSYGWDGDTIGKAALYVRGELADSTVFSKDTTVNQALSSSIDAVQLPRRVVKGLFEEDPFQSIVDSLQDPTLLLDALADAGWPTVRSLSTLAVQDVECNGALVSEQTILLDDLAHRVTVDLLGVAEVAPNCAISWPCSCTTIYSLPPSTLLVPWIADPLIPTAPGMGGSTTCHWVRTYIQTWSSTGETWFWCIDCAATGTQTITQTTRTTALPGDPCVPPP